MTLLDILLGQPLATEDEEGQKIGVVSGVAVLGLDGLSSAAYGPEAAMTVLLPLGIAAHAYFTPITLIILALLGIVYISYRQTIAAYSNGGGSYTVAKENLGQNAGLLAAAALILDYILNVAVGISAGIGALVSAVPRLHPYILPLCLAALGLIMLVNLRGVRESGLVFTLPTYMFTGSLALVIIIGIFKVVQSAGHPIPLEAPPLTPAAAASAVSFWLLVRSFASGCTAMTGVEAVSNGVNAFSRPAVDRAQSTLTVIVAILAGLMAGIAFLCNAYGIGATDPDSAGYQSVLSQLTAAVLGRGSGYYVTMGSVLVVLALSANTSFAGFPRLCRLLALDDFMPHAFASLGRRLVYSLGIVSLGSVAGLLLIVFGGITDRLIPLFAIGAFLAFTLSQAGMVAHWRRVGGGRAGLSLYINAAGCICTAIALVVILVAKFWQGACITLVLLPAIFFMFVWVRQHYNHVNLATELNRSVDLSNLQSPVAVVPLLRLNTISERALRYALATSTDVLVVHISSDSQECSRLEAQWQSWVEENTAHQHLSVAQLVVIHSPYRILLRPLLEYINEVKNVHPGRMVTVVIPELVERNWFEFLLHSQRALSLKAALLLYGDNRVVVVNIPWYLREMSQGPPQPASSS